jgi:hypothetical protein
MSLTLKSVATYLGQPASDMLSDVPFKYWTFERSFDNDLDEPVIDYIFLNNGMDLVCDQDDRVTTIFLHFGEDRHFDEVVLDLPPLSTRKDVVERLGLPSQHGDGAIDPILGGFGAWDRFSNPEYTIHIEYRVGIDRVKKLTFMRNDMVP